MTTTSHPVVPTHRPDAGTISGGVEFDIDEFGPSFGAEIRGVDVASATDAQVSALRRALIDYKVIVLRDQHLDDEAHIRFGNRLGDLTFGHPVWNSGDVPGEVYSLDSADNGFADRYVKLLFADPEHGLEPGHGRPGVGHQPQGRSRRESRGQGGGQAVQQPQHLVVGHTDPPEALPQQGEDPAHTRPRRTHGVGRQGSPQGPGRGLPALELGPPAGQLRQAHRHLVPGTGRPEQQRRRQQRGHHQGGHRDHPSRSCRRSQAAAGRSPPARKSMAGKARPRPSSPTPRAPRR